ncbi:hypothetical protein CYMTET_40703 [Cymbomonas tetramitiformis]|uniref:UDP-glucose 4-epimerase n=1 Tax=Cymbomonas tetramitiformis TaxID=36881 RepID=A0AAE0C8U8_9CHLO|nr:hypothetical protein CYMTET_40703 [Cymbomonas tetramitiformis]
MHKGPAILVTGGLGFIGSHTCVELLNAGYNIIVIDNLLNSKEIVKERIRGITGKDFVWYNVDLLDYASVDRVFQNHQFAAVIHFAALKAVGESVAKPLLYYEHNLASSLNVLKAMQVHGCRRFVFSSSATVYGIPEKVPLVETDTVGFLGDIGTRAGAKSTATNPYGVTKVFNERILEDLAQDTDWDIISLRYFNPAGAHPSGCIGEDPNGIPNNLVPFLLKGHSLAVDSMLASKERVGGYRVYNLGTGQGYSVLEMIQAMEKASGKKLPIEMSKRRPGDIAECYADASRAKMDLNFEARRSLDEMMADSWRFTEGKCTYTSE